MSRLVPILLFTILAVACADTGDELGERVEVISHYCSNCEQSGEIENGNDVWVNVDLIFEFLDGAGDVLGTDNATVEAMKPGQVRTFHGVFPGDPDIEDECRVVIKDVYETPDSQ